MAIYLYVSQIKPEYCQCVIPAICLSGRHNHIHYKTNPHVTKNNFNNQVNQHTNHRHTGLSLGWGRVGAELNPLLALNPLTFSSKLPPKLALSQLQETVALSHSMLCAPMDPITFLLSQQEPNIMTTMVSGHHTPLRIDFRPLCSVLLTKGTEESRYQSIICNSLMRCT